MKNMHSQHQLIMTVRHLLLGFALASTTFLSAQKKNVAVVTCYVDKYIDTSDLNGDASLAAGVATLAKSEN